MPAVTASAVTGQAVIVIGDLPAATEAGTAGVAVVVASTTGVAVAIAATTPGTELGLSVLENAAAMGVVAMWIVGAASIGRRQGGQGVAPFAERPLRARGNGRIQAMAVVRATGTAPTARRSSAVGARSVTVPAAAAD